MSTRKLNPATSPLKPTGAAAAGAAGEGIPGGFGTAALEPLPPVAGGGGGGEYTSARLGWGDLEGSVASYYSLTTNCLQCSILVVRSA